MAFCRFEKAAEDLKASLSNTLYPQALGDSIKLQTRPTVAFRAVNQLTAQQITNCYTSLHSWDDACDWLTEFESMKAANGVLAGVDPISYCDKYVVKVTNS